MSSELGAGVGNAHQQSGRVDVNGLDDGELLLDFLHGGPGSVELHLDPVADAAVLPLEGRHQRLLWELEAEGELVAAGCQQGHLPVI